MTKEERIAARKKTMADIVAKRDATIAREKNKSSSAKEKRAKRNTDFSAKVKEVNRTRKAKQKAKDEKRIAARKKVVNKIDKGVNKTIARGKKQRADNLAKRKADYAKFTANPKAKAKAKSTTSKSKSAPRAVDKGGRLSFHWNGYDINTEANYDISLQCPTFEKLSRGPFRNGDWIHFAFVIEEQTGWAGAEKKVSDVVSIYINGIKQSLPDSHVGGGNGSTPAHIAIVAFFPSL